MEMELLPALMLGLLLLAAAAGLIASHVRTWHRARGNELESVEQDYRRRQYRRRLQASGMIGLVGILLPLGTLIPLQLHPSLFVFFWFGVMLLTVWIMLLALGDMFSTRNFARRAQRENLVRQAKLRAELSRIQAGRRNGSPHHIAQN